MEYLHTSQFLHSMHKDNSYTKVKLRYFIKIAIQSQIEV